MDEKDGSQRFENERQRRGTRGGVHARDSARVIFVAAEKFALRRPEAKQRVTAGDLEHARRVQFEQREAERTARRGPREKFNEDGGESFHGEERGDALKKCLAGAGAEEADHHALDGELGGREQVGVARIFGAEKSLAALQEETLERGLAVDERGDDVARARLARGKEDDVVFDDVGADHGIAADAQREDLGVGAHAERGGVDGNVAVGFLHGIGRQAGRDHAEKRDAHERAARMVIGMEETAGLAGEALKRAFFGERIDVALDGERARETEVRLNFAERGRHASFELMGVDEIENLLLTGRERWVIGHSVQVNTSDRKCNFVFTAHPVSRGRIFRNAFATSRRFARPRLASGGFPAWLRGVPRALADFSLPELKQQFAAWGAKPSHAARVLREFYETGGELDFSGDSARPGFALPDDLLARLRTEIAPGAAELAVRQVAADGTTKLLLRLADGRTVESVLMPDFRADRAAGCISSQVGCAMGCDFCADRKSVV